MVDAKQVMRCHQMVEAQGDCRLVKVPDVADVDLTAFVLKSDQILDQFLDAEAVPNLQRIALLADPSTRFGVLEQRAHNGFGATRSVSGHLELAEKCGDIRIALRAGHCRRSVFEHGVGIVAFALQEMQQMAAQRVRRQITFQKRLESEAVPDSLRSVIIDRNVVKSRGHFIIFVEKRVIEWRSKTVTIVVAVNPLQRVIVIVVGPKKQSWHKPNDIGI